MSAVWVSSSVHLPDFLRTITFRWTLAVTGAFVLCIWVLFGFVYWQTAAYMASRIDGADKCRRTEGRGLGLSLVAAITNLRGLHFTIAGSPGCTAKIACG
jgi:hypothetical protein